MPLSRRHLMTVVLIFLLALVVRAPFLAMITYGEMGEGWDALGYYYRAVGLYEAAGAFLQTGEVRLQDWQRGYASLWPPLQQTVLALSLVLEDSLFTARLFTMLLSALTAPLVYLITRELSTEAGARSAATVYAVLPVFVHYSLRLYSETTFVFLFLFALYLMVRLTAPERSAQARLLSLAAIGVLLGLAALTRAAGLVWIPVAALWLGWRMGPPARGIRISAIVLASAVLTILPWSLLASYINERPVVITTSSKLALYLGNSPLGVYDTYDQRLEARRLAEEYADKEKIELHEAHSRLAWQTIGSDPVAFLSRGVEKWQKLWSPDGELARLLLSVSQRPGSNARPGFILTVSALTHFAVLALIVVGLVVTRPALGRRDLLLLLLGAAMASHFVTVADSRYNVPLQALLLPAAGHGLVSLRRLLSGGTLRALGMLAAIGVSWWFAWKGTLIAYSVQVPSAYNAALVERLDQFLGVRSRLADRIVFRNRQDPTARTDLSLRAVGFEIEESFAGNAPFAAEEPFAVREFVLTATTARTLPQIEVTVPGGERRTLTIGPDAWHAFRPTGIGDWEYLWAGGKLYPYAGVAVKRREYADHVARSPDGA